MRKTPALIDCHCHILPQLDDGAASWEEAAAMARMAWADGIEHVIATPHQRGAYEHITPSIIRERVEQMRRHLAAEGIPLAVHPGADVRIEWELAQHVARGEVLTLADQGRHLLIELPHDIVVRLDALVDSFRSRNMQLILTHPERNRRIMRHWETVESLVELGCLMQVTAGALTGAFGVEVRVFAEWLVQERLVHLVATDAHGATSRRPLLSRAYERIVHLTDRAYADQIFRENPQCILDGQIIPVVARRSRSFGLAQWFRWRRAI